MNTICVLAFVGFLVILFPVFLSLNVFLDVSLKKGCFAIYLFSVIKIHGGYATLYDNGIAFHLSKKKAVLLPFKDLTSTRKKFEITDGFQVYSYHQIIEIGSESSLGSAVIAGALIKVLSSAFFSVFYAKKKYLSLKSGTLLLPDKSALKISATTVAVFNLFVVAMAGIKILLEKIIEYGRRRKKQKSRRNG